MNLIIAEFFSETASIWISSLDYPQKKISYHVIELDCLVENLPALEDTEVILLIRGTVVSTQWVSEEDSEVSLDDMNYRYNPLGNLYIINKNLFETRIENNIIEIFQKAYSIVDIFQSDLSVFDFDEKNSFSHIGLEIDEAFNEVNDLDWHQTLSYAKISNVKRYIDSFVRKNILSQTLMFYSPNIENLKVSLKNLKFDFWTKKTSILFVSILFPLSLFFVFYRNIQIEKLNNSLIEEYQNNNTLMRNERVLTKFNTHLSSPFLFQYSKRNLTSNFLNLFNSVPENISLIEVNYHNDISASNIELDIKGKCNYIGDIFQWEKKLEQLNFQIQISEDKISVDTVHYFTMRISCN